MPKLTPKAEQALRLYATGWTLEEVCKHLGYSRRRVEFLIKSEEGQAFLAEFRKRLDQEFANLYSSVVAAIRDCLMHTEPRVRLEAANIWLKAHGKYKTQVDITVTAEDQVEKALYDEEVEVIDVDARPHPSLP